MCTCKDCALYMHLHVHTSQSLYKELVHKCTTVHAQNSVVTRGKISIHWSCTSSTAAHNLATYLNHTSHKNHHDGTRCSRHRPHPLLPSTWMTMAMEGQRKRRCGDNASSNRTLDSYLLNDGFQRRLVTVMATMALLLAAQKHQPQCQQGIHGSP